MRTPINRNHGARRSGAALLVISFIIVLGFPAHAGGRKVLATSGTGEVPVLTNGGVPQVVGRLDVAVDDLTVPAAERVARLTLVLGNSGPEAQVALCPLLGFGGAARTLQGYGYLPGDGAPDCSAAFSHGPAVSLTLDALPSFPPLCPAPAPAPGDIITVPAAVGGVPGRAVLVYEVLLQQLTAGLESLPAADVRAALAGGGGSRIEVLSGFGSGVPTLVCPAGVDALLAAAPDASVAIGGPSRWFQSATPVGATVTVPTSLSSAGTLGSAADLSAKVSIVWADNLPTPLSGHLTHDPPEGGTFTLTKATFRQGSLTATFPDTLPDGFLGQAAVVVTDAGSGQELARSIHLFAKDATPPVIEDAATARTDAELHVALSAADAGTPLNASRLTATVDGVPRPAALMDLASGDFAGPSSFDATIGAITPAAEVGAAVVVSDDLENAASATLPVAGAGPDFTAECDSHEGAHVTLDGSLSTFDPAFTPAFTWSDSFGTASGESVQVVLPLGVNPIRLDLEDSRGFTGTDGLNVTVVDTTPPVITSITPSPGCLWPPNHKYVKFALGVNLLVEAFDVCDPDVLVRVVGVTSSQPDNTRGDGNTANDALFGTGGMCLRSERMGGGRDGRTYTVTIEAVDDSGNTATRSAVVVVPHDQRNHGCPALDPSILLADGDPACSDEALALPESPGSVGPGPGPGPGDEGKKTFDPRPGKVKRHVRLEGR